MLLLCHNFNKDMPNIFYIDSNLGSDSNPGNNIEEPWQTLRRVNQYCLEQNINPGDKFLLRRGQTFIGAIEFWESSGTCELPITISSYSANPNDSEQHLPIIKPEQTNGSSVLYFKDCEHICINDVSLCSGTISFLFSKNNAKAVYSNFIISNIEISNILSDGCLTGALEFCVHSRDVIVKDIVVSNCKVKHINSHAITFAVTDYLKRQEASHTFKGVYINCNHLTCIGSTALQISKVHDIYIENNIFKNIGSISNELSPATPHCGLSMSFCDCVYIQGNLIENCFGGSRSNAITLDKCNENVLVQFNKACNNSGGFISILGGNKNVSVCFNLSQNNTLSLMEGEGGIDLTHPCRMVTLSDYKEWCYESNQPVRLSLQNIEFCYNFFELLKFSGSIYFTCYGVCDSVLFEGNEIAVNLKQKVIIEITNRAINLEFQQNTTNGQMEVVSIDNASKQYAFDLNTKLKNNNNDEIKELAYLVSSGIKRIKTKLINTYHVFKQQKSARRSSEYKLNVNSAKQFFKNLRLLTEARMQPTKGSSFDIYIVACMSMRKRKSILDNLKDNNLINTIDLSSLSLDVIFNNLDQLITTNLLNVIFIDVTFLEKGVSWFSVFCERYVKLYQLHFLFLVDNFFDELIFKFSKSIVIFNKRKHQTINQYFEQIEKKYCNIIKSILLELKMLNSNIKLIELCDASSAPHINMKNFWLKVAKKHDVTTMSNSGFKVLFDKLYQGSHIESLMVNEVCIDPLFFKYIEQQQVTDSQADEILAIQTKYNLNTRNKLSWNQQTINELLALKKFLVETFNFNSFEQTLFIPKRYSWDGFELINFYSTNNINL